MPEEEGSGTASRFSCTLGGSIASSQRRLKALLLGMGMIMLIAAIVVLAKGRVVAALLALAVALVARLAWRMSVDMTPVWLETPPRALTLRTRSRQLEVALQGASARALTADEIAHLEQLVAAGGFVVSTGGFDSHLLGEFDLYASNIENGVLVEAEEQRLILTPDEPARFLEALTGREASSSAAVESTPHDALEVHDNPAGEAG